MKILSLMALALFTAACVLTGHEHGDGPSTEHGAAAHAEHGDLAAALTPRVRDLLDREMLAIDAGMAKIGTALAQGEWHVVATSAQLIQDSFILAQALTPVDRAELDAKLPPAFLELDSAFHALAGKLVHAAHAGDAELATYYQFRMNEGCVSCHTRFAPERFPGLRRAPTAGHAH